MSSRHSKRRCAVANMPDLAVDDLPLASFKKVGARDVNWMG